MSIFFDTPEKPVMKRSGHYHRIDKLIKWESGHANGCKGSHCTCVNLGLKTKLK